MKGILSSTVEGWRKLNLKGIPGGDDGKVKTNDLNFIATGKSGIDICCRDNVSRLPSASIAIKLTATIEGEHPGEELFKFLLRILLCQIKGIDKFPNKPPCTSMPCRKQRQLLVKSRSDPISTLGRGNNCLHMLITSDFYERKTNSYANFLEAAAFPCRDFCCRKFSPSDSCKVEEWNRERFPLRDQWDVADFPTSLQLSTILIFLFHLLGIPGRSNTKSYSQVLAEKLECPFYTLGQEACLHPPVCQPFLALPSPWPPSISENVFDGKN